VPVILARNSYGKSRVRLVKVSRQQDRHDVKDLTVGIQFEGDFEAVHTAGDNSKILPTDTMKNTVYALAKQHPVDQIEHFGIALVEHFLSGNPQVSRIRVDIMEQPWGRLSVAGVTHRHAFQRSGVERRLALLSATRSAITIEAGIEDLFVIKTAGSGFEGYIKDHFTTLKETSDRVFATAIRAVWRYARSDIAFRLHWEAVRQVILQTFAEHDSRSVQHTLYAIGEAALEQCGEIVEMRLSLPSKHHLLVDLAPFGLDNRNEIFMPTEEPYSLIEAVVRRAGVMARSE
jgi:urate oxidase